MEPGGEKIMGSLFTFYRRLIHAYVCLGYGFLPAESMGFVMGFCLM